MHDRLVAAALAVVVILPFATRAQPNIPPRFIDTQYTATLQENEPVGTNVLQVSAVDNDGDQIMYELGSEAAGRFKINMITGQITSNAVIDREALSNDRLDFTAYAYDNVTGRGQRVNVPVSVVITDVNDNNPVFVKTPFTMSIKENVLGSTGFAASATDADNGRFALITYSITGGNQAKKFGIGLYTGTVIVIESVDYETKKNYTLTITATDGGGLTAVTSLNVQIEDVDDLPAVFSPSSYSATTSESASKGAYVTTVSARDGDLSLEAPVLYLVDQDTNPSFAFAIIESTGVITVNNTLDREKIPLYSLRIGAKSTNHKAVFATVTITISDVNDNVPKFIGTPYRGSVPENSPTGLTVLRVSARDADMGTNAVFEYSLVGASSKFSVTSAGDIVVSSNIDRETQDSYNFEVKAREGLTSERYQTTARVTINVTDVNDNNPQCAQAMYRKTVHENQPNQTEVVKIIVTDADIGVNADIRFSLAPDSGNHYKQFSIDPVSGVLKTMTTFDREKLSAYSLIVRVTDQPVSGQGRIGECSLTVTIGDENDNSPVLDNLPNTTDAVSEGTAPNTPVFTVLGSDRDAGINAAISYSVVSGNDGEIFAIQSSSGVVTLVKKLDREIVSNYTLGIRATDGGGKSVTSSLTLLVQDINDNMPVFTHSEGYVFAVNEGTIGLDVGTVKATDRDEGSNANIVYSLKAVEDYSKFTIDSTRGVIRTTAILDRETVSSHSIRVLAQDTGIPKLSAEVGVAINVTDINDHRPVFDQRRYTVTVLEKKLPHVILTLSATDADIGTNAQLSYVIESGNLDSSFVIDRDTGALATTKALDREHRALYSLLVTVADLHGNEAVGIPLKDSAIVEVTIQDINDNTPVFPKSLYSITIPENVPVGKDILKVQATDSDEGRNRELHYSIVSGNSHERFFIDASSGILYIKSALDRDPPRNEVSFNLKVMAKNTGNSSLNSTTTVTITVSDVNDSPPEFTSEIYTIYIPENITSGTVVLQPSCIDRDLGTNGQISYSIVSGNGESPAKFAIDRHNGRLSAVSDGFDYDVNGKKYTLVITAKDSGRPSLTGNATVIVHLENVNDNTPLFSQSEYLFTVREGLYIHKDKVVGKVTAMDSDSDSGNSPFGQVIYSFINQSSYYRDHHWPLTTLDSGRNTIDISGGVTARAVGSATVVEDSYLGHVISLSGSDTWIRVGDFENQCISDPSRCADGLTVAFWLLFRGGRYIISSGGQSPFGTGFAFSYTRETGKYSLLLATFTHKWQITLNSIPKTWFYAAFTWSSQSGLSYYENGLLVQSSSVSTSVSRASDAFTILSVGKPNNIDKLDYYGNLSISDLLVWKKELTDEEVHHSYRISRHVTGKPMPTLPQYFGSFDINPTTGEIKAIGLLDRETKSNYTLDVEATDLDPVNPRRNTSVVLVEVLDINDNRPVFSQESYVTTMVEHSVPGHTVIQIRASDRDSGLNSDISYSIVSGNTDAAFTISSNTGVISPAGDVDREKIQQYLLGVQAQDGGSPSLQATVQVTINIVDINDNTPIITPSTYSANVLENKPPGQVVLKISVLDPDHMMNGHIIFTVNRDTFVVNDTNGELLTTQELDRETKSYYELTITAKDQGSPPRSSSVKVRVDVLDENDNVPQFSKSLYRALIVENMTLGSHVVQVSATDPDQGGNGDIAYSIQGGDGIFVINKTSGVISVASLVDREARPGGFSLIVTARDHGYPKPNVATARVNITVSDINDNTPRFDKFTYVGVVREDSHIGAVVTSVRATDEDDGLAGMVLYSITSGDPGGFFAILNTSGNITVAKPLDRETRGAFELQITATDRAAEPKSSSVEVDITITDANDNRPFFVNVPSNILVSESALSDTPVFTVIATDQDLGINSQLTYSGYSPEGKFVIDAQSGVVKTVGKLDYEDVQKHVFFVIAMDKGTPQLNSSTLHLNVTVVDANDNNPEFTKPAYDTDISEAAEIGDDVIRVSATERDSGLGSVVGYNISAGDPGGHFIIDHASGLINVKKSLDRESQSTYTLLVTAKDGGTPPRFGQATVTIRLTDVNDRPPVFKFSKYQKEIPEDTAVGITVLTVDALDEDTPDNTQLTYSIIDGQDGDHFEMTTEKNAGEYTGVIKVAKPLDRETRDLFNLNVSVSDGLHTGYAKVEFRLSDVNDRNPEFNSSANYIAEIAENTPGGLLVIQVTAIDEDLGTSAVITYSITGTDGMFVINEKTGEIRRSSLPLNRETKSSYTLNVTATDSGGNHGFTYVYVRVIDKNDNSPVFNPSTYTVTLTEGPGTNGTFVTNISATDADEGTNQLIEYSIVSGNIGDVFKMDSKTGEIRTAKKLDREAQGISTDDLERGVYRLTIGARDHGNPVQSSTALVTVQIQDINDNPPVFPPNGYKTMISEGAKANQDVIAAIATDKDAGINKKLTYELISGNTGGDFTLDPDTGMIKTARNLERQQTFSYNLTIGAADQGNPSLSAMTIVEITVGDINDNTPVFNQQNYSASVYENSPVGTHLVNVKASDADSGQNAYISYSITGGDPLRVFGVETKATHGELIVRGNVDRELKDFYNLTITARDGGVPISRHAEVIVLVTVLDRNDNSPQFSSNFYSASIDENSGPGTPVQMAGPIRTTDVDTDVNAEIRYHLNGTESSQFIIDSITGVITTRNTPPPSLDHEGTTNYTFHVVAVDGRGAAHASFARVTVLILDTNDNTPTFNPGSKIITISESSPIGYSVTMVTATDPDSDLNGRIFYFINAGSEGKFEVGRVDGVIRVTAGLDREDKETYTLNISAIDGSYYPNEGYGTVIVKLQDVNDNQPIFTRPVFNVNVPEGTPVGTVVVNVTASDSDFGINALLTYRMNHLGFTINAQTGAVWTTQELDRETKQIYSFMVTARDGGGLESSVSVNVEIGDENDNSPQFPSNQYQTDILDKTSVGTIVLAVRAEDLDVGENGRVMYSIVASKDELFAVQPNTGLVTVVKTINRLQLVQSGVINSNGSIIFKVQARDHGTSPRSSNVTVVINIIDLGDDSPVFNSSSYLMNIQENQPAGTQVVRLRITKQRPGTTLTYSIASSQNVFTIDNSTGVISTTAALDRETRDYYILTARASDNGQTPLSGYTSVVVHVTDSNDNAPEFQFPAPYKMNAREDSPLGTNVGRVKALDRDEGDNREFEYAITHANIGPGLKMISINKECATPLGMTTGDVRASDITATSSYTVPNEDYSPTQGRLNNQPFNQAGITYKGAWCAASNNEQQYLQIDLRGMRKVTKIATQGRPGSSDYVGSYVISHSQDGSQYTQHRTVFTGNSDAETIQVHLILPAFHARYVRIHPQSWIGRICTRMELYGCESTGIDQVTLPFIIEPSSGYINTSAQLDREQQNLFTFVVQAKDKGSPSLNSTTTVEISITDTNDNKPVFSKSVYHASVPENAYGGYQVIRVTASDADMGTNAQLKYSIVNGGDGRFIIEDTSGIVRPSGHLDYESMVIKYFILNISASDGGQPWFSSTALLNISVTDFNDNKPVFNSTSYTAKVMETASVDDRIITVTAEDVDEGTNAVITYSLSGDVDTFRVVPNTGEIRLQNTIDREKKNQYELTITASDGGTPTLSSNTHLSIDVLDVNDNPPVFTSRVYARTMSEGVSVGTIVITVRANDVDIGHNGQVRYQILRGNDGGLFEIDDVTGAMRLAKPLNREANQTIKLTVLAKDQGKDKQLSDQAEVEIIVTDVNDNAPIIRPRKMTASVPENSMVSTFVLDVNATDDDIEYNGRVTYAIMHGDHGKFVINSTTGVVLTAGSLDRETKNHFTLIVMARDQGSIPYMDFGTIDVHVIDMNDNRPSFTSIFGPFSVFENQAAGTFVGGVTATDEDIGSNAALTYGILAGPGSTDFTVNSKTGEIITAKSLDRENVARYDLTVSVSNNDTSPQLTSTTVVQINVLDLNDKTPEFESSFYNQTISEASPSGTAVVTVSANDKDKGMNGRILYRIRHDLSSANSDVFNINAELGAMTLQVQIDDQEYRSFTVMVEAKDMASSQALSSVVPVYVIIDDVNDNSPVFSNKLYSVQTSESATVGTIIVQVSASDRDIGLNGKLTYKLVSGNEQGHFRINSSSGVITVNSPIDRETYASYRLIAGAFNDETLAFNNTRRQVKRNVDASGHMYDTTQVDIEVLDVNDNAPDFIRPLFVGGIPEGAELNTYILTVSATDADVGNYSRVSYRVKSGNEAGYFSLNTQTGQIFSASLFQNKKGQRFTLQIDAVDNNGLEPSNKVSAPALVRIFVLLEEQRVTLKTEVTPTLIEENRDEFVSVLSNITEAEVYIEQIFKVDSVNVQGEQVVESKVVFHAVKESTQIIMTSDEVIRTIDKYRSELKTMYAKWKIKAVTPARPTSGGETNTLSDAVLALIILGSLVVLLLIIILICVIKTRCSSKKQEMYRSPEPARRLAAGQRINRTTSWSFYDDVITSNPDKDITAIRMHPDRGSSFNSIRSGRHANTYSSYLLNKKRLTQSADDKIWSEGDYYLQDSKTDSYLDDDGGSNKSDISRPSTSRRPRDTALSTEGMPSTKV